MSERELTSRIAVYWDQHIHDLTISTCAVGTRDFFQQLDEYRYDKLNYLPSLVNSPTYRGRRILEVGCGVGIDLVRFAKAGAEVTGIDLSHTAIELACRNAEQCGIKVNLHVMNGEAMQFSNNSFDVVYAHGVLQYTADAEMMMAEIHRVLKTGGEAILMVYNRNSWLSLMRKMTAVPLEHEDAPVLKTFSIGQLRQMLRPFKEYRIVPERFPVRTRLHSGWKAWLFNEVFVRAFNMVPKGIVRPFGWHLMAFAIK